LDSEPWGVFVEELCDRFGDSLDGAGVGLAQQHFEFGEHRLERVEVRTIGGRKISLAPAGRIDLRIVGPLWLLRLSITTTSPGRNALEKAAAVQMTGVHLQNIDGRELLLARYTQVESEFRLLIQQLKLRLPSQPPPKITTAAVAPRHPM
jgi:hypothetical protein